MRRIPAWSAFLAAGLLAAGAYFLLPGATAQALALAGSLLAALLTIPVALRWHRPRHRLPWLLLGLGGLGVLLGNAAVALAPLVGGAPLPFPSWADLLYLAYYPLTLGGVLMLVRRRTGGRDRTGALDAAIATLSAGALVWAFAIAPQADAGALPPAARLVAGTYPLLDLLLLALALRLLLLPGPRLPAHALMAAALGATCAADVLAAALRLRGAYHLGHPVDAGWLLANALWGACALHPSLARLADPAPPDEVRLTRARLAFLAGAALAGPGTLVALAARGAPLDAPLVVGVSLALFLLALGRAADLAGRLGASEARFRALVQHTSDIITVLDAAGTVVYESPAVARVLGYHPADLVDTHALALVHPDDLPQVRHLLAELLAEPGGSRVAELRARHADGGWRHLLALGDNLLHDPAVGGLVVTSRDITERKRAEEALRAGARRYEALYVEAERQARELQLLDRVRTALARELDPAAVCRVVVEAIAQTFGYTQVSLYRREGGEHILQHQVGYDRVLARIPVTAGVSGRAVREGRALLIEDAAADPAFLGAIAGIASEICVPLRDGGCPAGFLNVESTGGVRLDEADLRLMAALGEQVGIALERARLHGELREREARLAHQATHDALTGLPNRALFLERLGQALARGDRGGRTPAVLFLDLDGFKGVNDRLGHATGDRLLAEAADRLRACARAGDTVARLGGDEFTILLAAPAGRDDAERLAGRVAAALGAPFAIAGRDVVVSASIGIAVAADTATGPEALLRDADQAMYVAKAGGKARHAVFDPVAHATGCARPTIDAAPRRRARTASLAG